MAIDEINRSKAGEVEDLIPEVRELEDLIPEVREIERRRRRHWRFGIVLFLVATVLLTAILAAGGDARSPSKRTGGNRPLARNHAGGRSRSSTAIGLSSTAHLPAASGIAAFGSAIWAFYDARDGYVGLREFSLRTGRTLHVAEGAEYGFENPTPLGIIGNRLLICNNTFAGHQSVTEIDARTGQLLGIAPGQCGGIAYFRLGLKVGDAYWLPAKPVEWQQTRTILKVSAATGAVLKRVVLPPNFYAASLVRNGGALYVGGEWGTDVAIIDLRSDTLVRTLDACGPTPPGKAQDPAQVPDTGGSSRGLAVTGTWLWTTCGDRFDYYGYLSRVNLADGQVQVLAQLGSTMSDLYAYGGHVWVTGQRGGSNGSAFPLLRVNAESGTVVGFTRAAENTYPNPVLLHGRMLIVAESTGIYVLSATTGRLLRVIY